MSVLVLDGVGKRYGTMAALDGVSLVVPSGSRTAIVGPSGSGKSTLLRLIAGFDAPDSGRITLDGAVLADAGTMVPTHRRGIGLVAQEGALFPHLSVADNIGFGLPRQRGRRDGRINDLAAMVGLDAAMLRRKPDALSGGQQQRVALARALACQPRLMLLDEPFSALDTGLRASTRATVSGLLAAAGITTILVTHDQVEALSFADQVAVLQAGRLLQAGPPRDVYLRPCSATVARFLGAAILLPAHLDGGQARCALGVVPVNDPTRHGTAEIMLREEQITLHDAPAPSRDAAAPIWMVRDNQFGGSWCTVFLALAAAPPGHAELVVRVPQFQAPLVGSTVTLSVAGQAHVVPHGGPASAAG